MWWKVVYGPPASSRWEHFSAVVYVLWLFLLIAAILKHSFVFMGLIKKAMYCSFMDRHLLQSLLWISNEIQDALSHRLAFDSKVGFLDHLYEQGFLTAAGERW